MAETDEVLINSTDELHTPPTPIGEEEGVE